MFVYEFFLRVCIWVVPILLGVVDGFATNTIDSKRPNILWIITDDQRADSLECFNEATTGKEESPLGYVSSPNINKLAKEGVLFTRAFCNSPMCTPSRGSMQSGQYPFRRGQYRWGTTHQQADFVKPFVSQTLRENGYGTAVFGKTGWGTKRYLDNQRNTPTDFYDHTVEFTKLQRNGYGDIYGVGGKYEFPEGIITPIFTKEQITYADGRQATYHTQFRGAPIPENELRIKEKVEREFEILRAYTRLNKGLILGGQNPKPAGETVDGYVVEEFVRYFENANQEFETLLGETANGADTHKPLFVNLSFHLPHTPVLPPKRFRDAFNTKDYKLPDFSTDELSNFPPQLVTLYNECKTDQLSDDEKLQAIQDYYAFCAYGDSLIGEAVERFKTYCEKHNQEWVIVFTVWDHGWHLGEQGIMAKFGPWTQSIRNTVIAVSSDQQRFPPNTVFNDIVEFVDFAPTILASAGIDVNRESFDHLDGYDLSEVVRHPEKMKREYAIGELNVVCGFRGFMRTQDFGFSMRTRDKWDHNHSPYLNDDILWALTCDREKADMALYDLRKDPDEKHNLAYDLDYGPLADWFRNKLGLILLGDGRVEADWSKPNSYSISSFARGADDKKLDIPTELIPEL